MIWHHTFTANQSSDTWWTCELVIWGDWRNDTTQFMSGVKELALLLWHLQLIAQLNNFLPYRPMSRYMYGHIWSKIPNIVELGQNLIFYVTGKVENRHLHGMNCFFLHCHPISYFIIHVCNQKTDSENTLKCAMETPLKFSNFSISEAEVSNFRVLDLMEDLVEVINFF